VSLERVRDELAVLGAGFIYFIDERDGRGKVLYVRRDGDYGLVEPPPVVPVGSLSRPPRPLAQRLPDPVELILDLAQPLVLAAISLGGGDQQERVLLADEVLDAGEQARLGRALGGIAHRSRSLRRRNAHRRGRRPRERPVNPRVRARGQAEHRSGQRVDREPVVQVRAAAADGTVREPAGAERARRRDGDPARPARAQPGPDSSAPRCGGQCVARCPGVLRPEPEARRRSPLQEIEARRSPIPSRTRTTASAAASRTTGARSPEGPVCAGRRRPTARRARLPIRDTPTT
jgi:hypothetical protein